MTEKLTRPQEALLARLRAHGQEGVTGSRHLTAMSLVRKGYPVEIVAETHGGEPCTPYAPPPGERWHWVARVTE